MARDIDFAGGAIHVREAKSGEGRSLPMNSVARAALLTVREARRARLKARVVNRSEADRLRVYGAGRRRSSTT